MHLFLLALVALTPAAQARELNPRLLKEKIPCSGLDLFEAVRAHDARCLRAAVKVMAPTETDADGNTALHEAIRRKNAAAILFLYKNGADLKQLNFAGQTPRGLAESLGYRPLAEYLSAREVETDRLLDAVEFRETTKIKQSLLRGASLSTRDVRQDTALHRAAQSGFAEVVEALVRAGAPLEARNYLGETPLHSAAMRGHTEAMRALLKAGANANAVNERRETPLDLSGRADDSAARNLLLGFGAKPGNRADVSMGDSSGGE